MKKTQFYDMHVKSNAKMVEFAGYLMPIQYSSIIAEHKAVREKAGVFDVSHMGEVFVSGPDALKFVQKITVNDAGKLFPGRVQYSAMCYPEGGIVDDLLVYCLGQESYLLVINASNIDKDIAWMNSNAAGLNVTLANKSDEYSLLAVQGPQSKEIVESAFGIPLDLEYYHFINTSYMGTPLLISRTGYTGELGFEIYFSAPTDFAHTLWTRLFEAGAGHGLQPVGLGARDSLRLEMGFCLYGNDIDQTTNPLEAGLAWITKLNKGSFNGKEALLKVKEAGLKRKLVPMFTNDKAFPRHGYDISVNGIVIGQITSGTVSPVLDKGIAMGYVEKEFAAEGTQLNFVIRGKEIPAEVTKLPFIQK